MTAQRSRQVRVLRLDVSETPARLVFVTKREAGLYFRAYIKPSGADVLTCPTFMWAPWKPSGMAA